MSIARIHSLLLTPLLALALGSLQMACSSAKSRSHEQANDGLILKPQAKTLTGAPPIIIAHRGASGHLPEETLEAYQLAIEQGADFIEPDLVPTKDGVLIARHENNLTETTNVAEVFPNRKTTKTIDGKTVEGYFSEDFTLKEIQKLRARERLPFRNQSNNDKFKIATLTEVLDLAKAESKKRGRTIGVYPETKHPTYFKSIGLPLEERLLAILKDYGYEKKTDPIIIQSFEPTSLKFLRAHTHLRLIQLYSDQHEVPYDIAAKGQSRTYGDLLTDAGLKEVAIYADGIGPWKNTIYPQTAEQELEEPTELITRAHEAGLMVHAYTFRNDKVFLAKDYQEDPALEFQTFFNLGIDGVFTDYPDTGIRARQDWSEANAK